MASTFRRVSRVSSLSGATKWYLSEDCLLAAKRVLYVVEYRRFYLRDIESIIVWPNRLWLLRPIIPGALLLALGALLWSNVGLRAGIICAAIACGWAALELALGPTAGTRIQTTGAIVDLPLVGRTRRAKKTLAKIDAAIHVARGGAIEQPAAPIAEAQAEEAVIAGSSDATSGSTPSAAAT